jgi:hypothetical protein
MADFGSDDQNQTDSSQDEPLSDELHDALIEEAREAVDKSEQQVGEDVDIFDDTRSAEERKDLIERLAQNVLFLDAAKVENGQKFTEYIWAENNPVDRQLIDLDLIIPIDNFKIKGTYDLEVIEGIIYDLAQYLPEKLYDDSPDDNAVARRQTEQKLIEKNLSSKIKIGTKSESSGLVPIGEVDAEFDQLESNGNPDDKTAKDLKDIAKFLF